MRTATLLTFEKQLAAGVTVRIRNIPGTVSAGGEHDYRKQFVDRETRYRLEGLMDAARRRMALGEKEIQLDFAADV